MIRGRTDIHCHILPGIDDGAKDLQQSLRMARIAVADGITTLVATPHHLNGVYRNPAGAIRAAVQHLQAALDAEGLPLQLLAGSELHLVPELPAALAAGEALTVGDLGHAVLVELPVHSIPVGSEQILQQIQRLGLVPIVAHPERNTELRHQPERLADWVAMGCLAQVTAQSCTGLFGPLVESAARHMIQSGLIHFVASDAHRDLRRIPQISPACAQLSTWTNPTVAELIGSRFPALLAAGQIPDLQVLGEALPTPAARPRPWWRRWRF